VTFIQALFVNGALVSKAESVVVHVDAQSRRGTPISPKSRAALALLGLTR
jgi:acyl-CoA thioesterase FadM